MDADEACRQAKPLDKTCGDEVLLVTRVDDSTNDLILHMNIYGKDLFSIFLFSLRTRIYHLQHCHQH